jgi:hypothetical protein
VGAPLPKGGPLYARYLAALLAVLVPVFLLLPQFKAGGQEAKGWETYDKIDIVTLIVCVISVVAILASLRSVAGALPAISAGMSFAAFGLVLAAPLEASSNGASIAYGGILAFLAAFLSGAAAVFVASTAITPGGETGLVGAGRGASALHRQPGLPTGAPQQPAQAASGPAPGWYPDPNGVAKLRYFDGLNWTDQTSN